MVNGLIGGLHGYGIRAVYFKSVCERPVGSEMPAEARVKPICDRSKN